MPNVGCEYSNLLPYLTRQLLYGLVLTIWSQNLYQAFKLYMNN